MSNENKNTKRNSPHKLPGNMITVFCEGKTEEKYLNCFKSHHRNNNTEVEGAAGAPRTLVEKAVAKKKALTKTAKKDKNRLAVRDEVWVVFDIDEHPNIPQAIDMAKGNTIYTAISNPCIEIWPLLHFTAQNAYIHRHALQSELAKHMPSYKSDGSKIIDYDQIKQHYQTAKDRAINLTKTHQASNAIFPHDNPSTTFYQLLGKIIANGKGN